MNSLCTLKGRAGGAACRDRTHRVQTISHVQHPRFFFPVLAHLPVCRCPSGSVVTNRIFARFTIDEEILWPVLVYPCLALFFACAFWLILF